MNKRILSCLLALVVALASLSVACAEFVPSINSSNVVNVSTVVSASGAVLPADFGVAVAPQSETTIALATEIAEFAKSAPVADYFGEEVMASVATMIPAIVNTSALKVDELLPMVVSNYDAAYGDVILTLSAAAVYSENDVVVVLAGVVIDGVLTWIPLEASVTGGAVNVVFTQEVLEAAGSSELVFALLRAE